MIDIRSLALGAIALFTFSNCQNSTSEMNENTLDTEVKEGYYDEQHRPKFHFTPEEMWMNDPNGLFYNDGLYHLYYQHYPEDKVWGPMHWGHATSKDLVHWTHHPIALFPDSLGYMFSGSAVLDKDNSSGFGSVDNPPVVAAFTFGLEDEKEAGQTQGLAYSLDGGFTFEKYKDNPVIDEGRLAFRDPKVIWHKASQSWVMLIVAGSTAESWMTNHIRFYRSKDLKNWAFSGDFGFTYGTQGVKWECPDLFETTIAETEEKKWVLTISVQDKAPNGGTGCQYFIGDFDGNTFTTKIEDTLWLDYGRDNYAGVLFNHAPENRPVYIGWMSNWQYTMQTPTSPWRSAMTVPRSLTLVRSEKGPRLLVNPVKELEVLRGKNIPITGLPGKEAFTLAAEADFPLSTSELILEFDPSDDTLFEIVLSNTKGEQFVVGYDAKTDQFFTDRTQSGKVDFSEDFPSRNIAPRFSQKATIKMHILFDKSSCELFADDGSVVMTDIFFPNEDFSNMTFGVSNGSIDNLKGNIFGLKSIW
ncbi:MAG: glycoside hydrolase family 32 protein [Bacteroidota bacterium]